MKKSLLLFFAMMGLTATQADNYDYPYLVFQQSDGTVQSVAVESLVLTIDNGQLVATNASGTQSFTLSQLSQMYFATNVTAIGEVETATITDQPVEVFTLAGTAVGKFENISQAKAALSKGIYVVKSESQTLKIAVR